MSTRTRASLIYHARRIGRFAQFWMSGIGALFVAATLIRLLVGH